MRKKGLGLLLSSTIALIVIVLVFTGSLIVSSYRKNYTDALMASYAVVSHETVQRIEYAAQFGKPLDNFFGMEQILAETRARLHDITELQLVLPDGRIAYTEQGPSEAVLDAKLAGQASFADGSAKPRYILDRSAHRYWLFLPIREEQSGRWLGSLAAVLDQSALDRATAGNVQVMVKLLVGLAVGAAAVLVLLITWLRARGPGVLVSTLLVLALVQVVYGTCTYWLFSRAYVELAHNTAAVVVATVQQNIDSVIEKGVTFDQLNGLDDYLHSVAEAVPQVSALNVKAVDGSHGLQARVDATLSTTYLHSRQLDIVLDTGTALVVSLLFMVELSLFTTLATQLRLQGDAEPGRGWVGPIVRATAFVACIGLALPATFRAVAITNIMRPVLGLPQGFLVAAPMSAEMLFAGLGGLVAGGMADRRGWRITFGVGTLLSVLGLLLSGAAGSPVPYIAARAICGAGQFFIAMGLRGLINAAGSQAERGEMLAKYFAGMYAGFNCGTVVGGMLADRFGYALVFYLAAGLVTLAGAIFWLLVNGLRIPPRPPLPAARVRLGRFLLNPRVLAVVTLVLLPYGVCWMFQDYYFPLFASGVGASNANIGRIFLVQGLCLIFGGPLLTRLAQRALGVRNAIVAGCLLLTSALLVFAWHSTLAVLFAAILLLGIAEGFSTYGQTQYVMVLAESQSVGPSLASGFLQNSRLLGNMLGPLLFSLAAASSARGVGAIGLAALVLGLGFLACSRQDRPLGLPT